LWRSDAGGTLLIVIGLISFQASVIFERTLGSHLWYSEDVENKKIYSVLYLIHA
jgi:hypothetical protein